MGTKMLTYRELYSVIETVFAAMIVNCSSMSYEPTYKYVPVIVERKRPRSFFFLSFFFLSQ